MSAVTAPPRERDAVWNEVRERLRSTLNSQTYKFAFAGARPLSLTHERLVLGVDTELLRQWIHQRYLPLLRDALFEICGADLQVEVLVVKPTEEETPAAAAAPPPRAPRSPSPSRRPPPRCRRGGRWGSSPGSRSRPS